ncbi:FAD-dependent oxidoreductase [Methylophaga sp.]|uniref:FAD-dependent oxidoreductase n=1 Tax=Methylophaga sp. TaxID=2024840 RepID=UPI003A9175CA
MKVVIVGGVAAGMSAAARARRLSEDAEIIVLEKTQYVSFANCGLPYHLGNVIEARDSLLLQTPESLAASLNLDVRTGHEVTKIMPEQRSLIVKSLSNNEHYQLDYDKLVLTPGASPVTPNLPGIENPKIFTLRNIEDMDRIKASLDKDIKRAVVVGAGYIGLETAENFKHIGLDVTIVEHNHQVMPLFDKEMARDLSYHLQYHGINLKLGQAVTAFSDSGKELEITLGNNEKLSADLVLLAVGVKPDTKLLEGTKIKIGQTGGIVVDPHMQTSVADIYAAGDAVEVTDHITQKPALIALAGPANRQGRIIADHIFGKDSQYLTTQGTAILKVFDMTAGLTGASETRLKEESIDYRKIYIHPSGHAAYYPGTHSMHLKLLFTPVSGKILGAQIVGYDGVDKRIDVFAVALRAGLTVFDLENQEFAYAPPYGAAKDPVNIAGFVAANLLQGDIDFWYAEEFDSISDGLIVDVRSEKEFNTWHIEGAINIPLASLRQKLQSLPVNSPIYLYCRVGFRSYLAHRVLVQSGFKQVKTLAGGSKTFCSFHKTPLCTGKPGLPFVAHAEDLLAQTNIIGDTT